MEFWRRLNFSKYIIVVLRSWDSLVEKDNYVKKDFLEEVVGEFDVKE